jgi:hypothetical protein
LRVSRGEKGVGELPFYLNLKDPMAYSEGKGLVLLSLVLGFALAAFLSLPHVRYMGYTAISMAAAPSAMTQLQPPMAWRSMPPSRAWQPLEAYQFEHSASPDYNEEPQVEPSSFLANQKRRDLLAAGAFALAGASVKDRAALAAYGDGANIFGGVTNPSGFVAYAGDGFSLLIPSKYGPSKERDFPGIVLRYEDNQDIVNQLAVIKMDAKGKSKMEDYGTLEAFLKEFRICLVSSLTMGRVFRKAVSPQTESQQHRCLMSKSPLIRRG